MSRRTMNAVLCLIMTGVMTVCVSAANKNEESPLTAQGEKLLATYTGMLEALKAEIVASAPSSSHRTTCYGLLHDQLNVLNAKAER